MSNVVHFELAKLERQKANTLKAMLEDTRDLFGTLSYADEASKTAAQAQVEAINEVLTNVTIPA